VVRPALGRLVLACFVIMKPKSAMDPEILHDHDHDHGTVVEAAGRG
jgi:hypothetical protein